MPKNFCYNCYQIQSKNSAFSFLKNEYFFHFSNHNLIQNDRLFLKYYTFTICLKNCVRYSKSNMKSPGKLLCFQPMTPFEGLIFRREIQNISTLLQLFSFFTTEPLMLRALRGGEQDRSEHFLSLFSHSFLNFFQIPESCPPFFARSRKC